MGWALFNPIFQLLHCEVQGGFSALPPAIPLLQAEMSPIFSVFHAFIMHLAMTISKRTETRAAPRNGKNQVISKKSQGSCTPLC